MYDKESHSPATVKTSTLNEDLGKVKFIFSDKTGTLTKNIMSFKRMSIEKESYGQDNFDKNLIKMHDDYGVITNFLFHDDDFYDNYRREENDSYNFIKHFLLCLSLCNSVSVGKDEMGALAYSSTSPDEMALIMAARKFGHVLTKRLSGGRVAIDVHGKERIFQILNLLEFTDAR